MNTDYTIRIIEPNDYNIWDSFVDSSPQGTLFHTSKWLSESGLDFRLLGCYNKNGDLLGGFVCGIKMINRKWTFFTHPSFTPYLGIIYADHKGKYLTRLSRNKQICHEFAKAIKKHCDTLNITMSAYELDDVMPFIWENFTASLRYTYILKLGNMDNVWKNVDERFRNNIKKAQKDKLWIDNECGFDITLKLAEKTFQRQDMKLNEGFIERATIYNKVLSSYSQCKSFVTKTNEGKPIASLFMVWDKKRSYAIISGHDFENEHRGALRLAQWASVEYTKNVLGLYEYDFEGTTLMHTERYIREFGGWLVPYYTIKWTSPKLKPLLTAKRLIRDVYHAFKPLPLTGKIITD